MSVLLTIVTNRFDRTTSQRFFTRRFFFLSRRLTKDKRVTVGIRAHEVLRRCVATDVTIYTGGVYVIGSGHILFYAVVAIRHKSEVRSQKSEVRGQRSEVRGQK